MGLQSGIMWAPYNVDDRNANGFADSPFQPVASYVSWGNTVCHEPDRDLHFNYDWGSGNDGPYSETPGSAIGNPDYLPLENDVAHVICGRSWRLPTSAEFTELLENTVFIDESGYVIPDDNVNKRITMNGVLGVRLRSIINGAAIFIPCGGRGEQNVVITPNSAYYWASDLGSVDAAKALVVTPTVVSPATNVPRYRGLPVRPVWDPSL